MDKRYQSYVMSLKTLDAQTERDLILEYKATGSQKAKNTLVDHFMKLIIKMAKDVRMKTANDPENGLDDLISDGVIGFLIALDKFDTTRTMGDVPIRISTYAKFWIRVFIQGNALNRKSTVYKMGSGKLKGVFFKVPKMMAENGWHSPLSYENAMKIAAAIGHGVTPDEVISMERLRSMGDVRQDAWRETLAIDEASPEEQCELNQMRDWMRREMRAALKDDPRGLDILTNRTYADSPEPIETFMDRYQVSKERIRQIEKDACSKLHAQMIASAKKLSFRSVG